MPTIQARPTTYKGIQMRSRLEAAFAEQFDAWNYPWEYEPGCFASDEGQYLPDFAWSPNVFVEVKPPVDGLHIIHDEAPRWSRILTATNPKAVLFVFFGANTNGVIHVFGVMQAGDGRHLAVPFDGYGEDTPVPSLHAKRFI